MRTVIWILAGLAAILAGYLLIVNLWPTSHGSVVVISDPPGAQVWIDLEPTSVVTDGKVTHIPRGKHSITVKLDTLLADPFAVVAEVRGGKPDTVRFTLRTPRGEIVTTSVGNRLPTAPQVSLIDTTADVVKIPTAAEVRGPVSETGMPMVSTAMTDTPLTASLPLPPPNEPEENLSSPAKSKDTGVIAVSSSQKGATIYINDKAISEKTPANVPVPFGTYTIRAELEGYKATPDEQSVRVRRTAASQSVHFTLEKAQPETRAINVETAPVEGRIFIDGMFAGEGKASVERDLGSYVVTFGDLEGWRKPSPVRVTLSPAKPSASVSAKYVRLFHAFAQADGAREGIDGTSTGVIFDKGKTEPSAALGPKVTPIPDANKSGWELGMGDPNHNPTGGDYVAFTFKLPEDVPSDTPLNLRLYIYKSAKRYPFSLASHAEIVVQVNGRRFLDTFSPRFSTAAAAAGRFEEWSLQRMLKPGENQILVYAGKGNTVFNYLWKVEIQ